MIDQATDPIHGFLSIAFFPQFFQIEMMTWAWGANDPFVLMGLKRALLLLPCAALLVALWASIAAIATVPFRQKRGDFITSLLATWWDLAKGIMLFWAGVGKLLVSVPAVIFALFKSMLVFLWLFIQDVVMVPYRIVSHLARSVSTPGLPWIAFVVTLAWCLLEAVIFTYVMTPLVLDTLSNMTGEALTETVVRIPLFLFMFFLILGSYAVLSTFADALKSKDVSAILRISVIEVVAIFVEVMFLYREFVDSLVPWFAQYSAGGFELSMAAILGISFFMWAGIRGMTWYLFASYGTPTILAILKGSGLSLDAADTPVAAADGFGYTFGFYRMVKKDIEEMKQQSQDVAEAIVLPPLQVAAATMNFLSLVATSKHMLEVPLYNLQKVMEARPRLADTVAPAARRKMRVEQYREDERAS